MDVLTKIVQRKPNLVIFGSNDGTTYADNSMHLYEWILQNRADIQAVWMTRNKNIYQELKQKSKPVAMITSWNGLKILAQAKVGVFSNSLRDLAWDEYLVPNSIYLIALRHGKSVKRVRFARHQQSSSERESIPRQQETELIYKVLSTSEFISDIQEECLQLGRHKHVVTGYPRNDMLLSPSQEAEIMWQKFLNGLEPRLVALYAPTQRHGREPTRFFPFEDFDKDKLISFLQDEQILLLLRPHLKDFRRYPDLRELLTGLSIGSEYVRFASHDVFPDVNHVLPYVNVLISDYSSIYHDYLLLNRPLMYIPYDFEEFNRQHGFLYVYFAYRPGPAIETLYDFCAHLDLLSQGEDPYMEKRNTLRNKIHFYQDSNSCDRVTTLVDRILEYER